VIYLLDTGPLVSALDREESRYGDWAKELLRRLPHPLYTCDTVLAEAAHLLSDAEIILNLLGAGLLICPWNLSDNYARVRELVVKYADQPMDLADACIVAMSEHWHAIPLLTPD
jgi:uncharacterized protein